MVRLQKGLKRDPAKSAYLTLKEKIQSRTRDGATIVKKLAEVVDSERTSGMEKIAACRLLLEYGWGKSPQPVEVSGKIDLIGILEQVHAGTLAHAPDEVAATVPLVEAQARVVEQVLPPPSDPVAVPLPPPTGAP